MAGSDAAGAAGDFSEPGDIAVRELTATHARTVGAWRYGGAWAVYDGRETELISAELGYHAIVETASGRFLGYFCLGAEARVPGLEEEAGVLDVGAGLDPVIVGKGRGAAILSHVLEWVAARTEAGELRAVVQAWNERSLRLCRRLGFRATGHHSVREIEYVVLRRPLRLAGKQSWDWPGTAASEDADASSPPNT